MCTMTYSKCDVTRRILDIDSGDQVHTYTRHCDMTHSIFDVYRDSFET